MAKANPSSSLPTPNKVFAGKTFVLQGDFGKFPRTHLNITRLIVKHGGRVNKMVTDKTTLLVTTIEEFKKMPPSSASDHIPISLLSFGELSDIFAP